MNISSSTLQIKAAFEENSMSPELIAEDLGFDIVAVKSCLMANSSKYRRACGQEEENESELNFSNRELAEVNQVIMDTARGATLPSGDVDWGNRLKAAMYVRDDKKGRKEVVKAVQNTQNNVMIINEMLQSAREGANKLRNAMTGQKAIEA
jgi:hypothetical protein